MPYTGNAVLTEYFRVMELPESQPVDRFTQIVDDPEYLTHRGSSITPSTKLSDARNGIRLPVKAMNRRAEMRRTVAVCHALWCVSGAADCGTPDGSSLVLD